MGEREEAVLETKLDILIKDFQRFREEQRGVNTSLSKHGSDENEVQAKILTTLKWHTVIGTFMVGVIMTLVYIHIGGK